MRGIALNKSVQAMAESDGPLLNEKTSNSASVNDVSASDVCETNWPEIAQRKLGYENRSRRRT
jgi:hypothetical protein